MLVVTVEMLFPMLPPQVAVEVLDQMVLERLVVQKAISLLEVVVVVVVQMVGLRPRALVYPVAEQMVVPVGQEPRVLVLVLVEPPVQLTELRVQLAAAVVVPTDFLVGLEVLAAQVLVTQPLMRHMVRVVVVAARADLRQQLLQELAALAGPMAAAAAAAENLLPVRGPVAPVGKGLLSLPTFRRQLQIEPS